LINQIKRIYDLSCFSFCLLKVNNNGIELPASEGYTICHTSSNQQTISTDTKDRYLSDVLIRKTVNGAYDNPTMIMKF